MDLIEWLNAPRVKEAIIEAQKIRETVKDIACIEDKRCWLLLEFITKAVVAVLKSLI